MSDTPTDQPTHDCPHCGGPVAEDFTDFSGACSEVCDRLARHSGPDSDGALLPTPVGPASHDEIEGWIAVADRDLRQAEASAHWARIAAAEQASLAAEADQAAWDEAVDRAARQRAHELLAEWGVEPLVDPNEPPPG